LKLEIQLNYILSGRRGKHIRFGWESQEERDHYEDLEVGGRIILRWILEK
jgi:hypothetical protein